MPWPMFERVWKQEEVMHEMMVKLGVDPVAVARLNGGDLYSQLQTTCVDCVHADICRAWLRTSGAAPIPSEFCGNYETFVACRAQ